MGWTEYYISITVPRCKFVSDWCPNAWLQFMAYKNRKFEVMECRQQNSAGGTRIIGHFEKISHLISAAFLQHYEQENNPFCHLDLS
jgi:hypothetical protein